VCEVTPLRLQMVHDSALHGEATVGANREEQEGLAGRPSLEGEGSSHKAGELENDGIYPLFRAVDAVEVDALGVPVVKNFESIAVEYADHWPGISAAREGSWYTVMQGQKLKSTFRQRHKFFIQWWRLIFQLPACSLSKSLCSLVGLIRSRKAREPIVAVPASRSHEKKPHARASA